MLKEPYYTHPDKEALMDAKQYASIETDIEFLELEEIEAVKLEDYETAAIFRDRIKQLKQ